ncbi:2-oxoacid dehydrogenase subunit E1 [Pseudomonas syringae pv. rhaphiolepidis]|nr:2-oxoacid dehydrogenase subunit E1 [Pseudomonas syringae pv. rhaphiolepidis]
MAQQPRFLDEDPQETREWLESIESVLNSEGRPRAHYLIDQLLDFDVAQHGDFYGRVTTPYVNTIPSDRQQPYRLKSVSTRSSAGTPWRWYCVPASIPVWAAILPPMRLPPCSMTWGSITSSGVVPSSSPAIWSTSRAILRRAFTAGRTWKVA